MADKLSIYNQALGHLRERTLASLGEAREPRRVLDAYWADCVAYCLDQGLWKFMKRVAMIDASTTVVPAFGFIYAFTLPQDWVRTVMLSTTEALNPPLLQYAEENGYWYTNWTPIYVSYISSDPLYGGNLGEWSPAFAYYVSLRLAALACGRVTNSDKLLEWLEMKEKKARIDARAKDAMNDPPGFAPVSTWVRSRRGFQFRMAEPGGEDGSPPGIP